MSARVSSAERTTGLKGLESQTPIQRVVAAGSKIARKVIFSFWVALQALVTSSAAQTVASSVMDGLRRHSGARKDSRLRTVAATSGVASAVSVSSSSGECEELFPWPTVGSGGGEKVMP